MSNYRNEATDRLLSTIVKLKDIDECYAFFDDICTIKEILDMAQRFDTAIRLDRGESYSRIASEVGVSTATISRVNRCLEYGAGGYRNAIEKMKEETENADR
ncbi:MAG: hypothetical protein KBT31_01230 [Firmicutes bacterium]|nr:hypothetical protein [Candidatus Colimorpha enterica]